MLEILKINLHLFDGNPYTNVTTDGALSDEMKTYYDRALLKLAEAELVHNQFGQKKPIPKNNGKIIEFRGYDSLPKALTALSEGVTPDGQKLSVYAKTAQVKQYGGYVTISDLLELTAIDNNMMEATELIASQAARTLDTLTREVLCGGTNVQYGAGTKTSRSALVGGDATPANNDYMSVLCIRKAVRTLKKNNTRKINGAYVGIIHPDVAFDLMSDSEWKAPHQYQDTANLYNGEIGMIAGVRFVESTEAKMIHAADLIEGEREFAVNGAVSNSKSVVFDGNTGAVAADALKGRLLQFYDATNGWQIGEVASNTASSGTATITMKENITLADNAKILPGEAGRSGRDVYCTLILGSDAYGITEIEGGGLQHIVKQLGSGGTADPLNQRATVGWKATHVAKILIEQYMVRIETASSFNDATASN